MTMSCVVAMLLVFPHIAVYANFINVTEKDLANLSARVYGESVCDAPDEVFCEPDPKSSCEARCTTPRGCKEVICTNCPSPDQDEARAACKVLESVILLLEKGAINIEGASLFEKMVVTSLLHQANVEFCDDGRIVCEEVGDGCVAFDDICREKYKDCQCGLDQIMGSIGMILTPGYFEFSYNRRDVDKRHPLRLF
ncbi:uncharacterized protein [Ptychodera flava]|uniref:uncharacterized protein n=1 Tax=Ptychodera flava TaxID=63121 RepID=UPI00396A421D